MNEEKKLKIFLIGYMGSGKTTLGKYIAQKTGLQFIDMDLFIENRYHKTINAIFDERGEDGFRQIERNELADIAQFENVVVSTGGGLPCFFDNIDLMNDSGITVYLKTNEDLLVDRLYKAKEKRPLIRNKNRDELRVFVKENLQKREIFYNKAKIIYDCNHLFRKTDFEAKSNELISLIYSFI
ncbi:MAG: shikimate kinase [Dysgonamonadaceae bacterium]|jgi:shikimate kinase|nr:shikimate kinase [Dysgonamonadaceae bacterium]